MDRRRATRRADGDTEMWRFARTDASLARRLAEHGAQGVTGFAAWGEDPEGAWVRRTLPRRMAEDAPGIPWREALCIVREAAAALAACERLSLSPGRLHPAAIAIDPGVWIEAGALVEAIVGESLAPLRAERRAVGFRRSRRGRTLGRGARTGTCSASSPTRLLAGEHPFGGAGGLRQSDRRSRRSEAPPFEAQVAARTRPGRAGA